MNNFEKIKAMDIEEMAKFFDDTKCSRCFYNNHKINCLLFCYRCFNGIKQWLESESEV